MLSIQEIASKLGIQPKFVEPYGNDKAKIRIASLKNPPKKGKLILVSALTPTPSGEGKTTTSIGLAQGLAKIGKSVSLALRQPSMGPVFGRKGGATGGGMSRLTPSDAINLQFTGDFHAITAAHNLLAAVIDNRLHFKKGGLGREHERSSQRNGFRHYCSQRGNGDTLSGRVARGSEEPIGSNSSRLYSRHAPRLCQGPCHDRRHGGHSPGSHSPKPRSILRRGTRVCTRRAVREYCSRLQLRIGNPYGPLIFRFRRNGGRICRGSGGGKVFQYQV
jgi:hypothetical protein